ncbi:MAG: tetratricopeptide repeat protein, partial [Planctomycetes bacterium]|nr:tetratricopeptide repeat protein [Planctomycetota bacterium]
SMVRETRDPASIWKDPEFRERLAQSYVAETDIEPRVSQVEREQLSEVFQFISDGKTDLALALLERLRGDAASAAIDFTIANLHLEREQADEALAAYQVAVQKHPKFRRAWQMLGEIQVQRGDFEQALPALTRVIELGGGDGFIYGAMGIAYTNAGDFTSAESAFRMATMFQPQRVDWKFGLAETLFRQERFADAIALFETLIAAQPDRADLWRAQGDAYAMMEQPMKAAENYEMVDRLGGATADTLNNLGDIYANQQLFDLAVDGYLRSMVKAPQQPFDRHVRAARFLAQNGAFEATASLIKGIEDTYAARLDETARTSLLHLQARMAAATGAADDQAQVLAKIVELNPLDGEALILLGEHAARIGNSEEAIFYYERAANLEAFTADASLRHAELLVRQSHYAEALPLLRRAQKIKPRDNVQEYLDQVELAARNR